MIDRRYEDFWWGANLWRRKRDEASYQALLTMRADHKLPVKIINRIAEIEHEHKKYRSGSLGSASLA